MIVLRIVIKKEGGGGRVQIPVLPPSFSVERPYHNEEVEINKIGTVNLIGRPGLQTVSFSSFFPAEFDESYMQTSEEDLLEPYQYIKKLKKLMGNICRIVITGTNVNMLCTIENLSYSEDDGTGNVQYTLQLKQYKKIGVRVVKTAKKAYTTKKGDTFKKIAKKEIGSASKAKEIYQKNKKVAKKAFDKYINRFCKTPDAKKKYKNTAVILRELPAGVRLSLSGINNDGVTAEEVGGAVTAEEVSDTGI